MAPIWSIFWHHALFGTPIFDVYTHMAYHWDITGAVLSKKEAMVHAPGHWPIFDRYRVWFEQTVKSLQVSDSTLTERDLDRALVCWEKIGQRSSEQRFMASTYPQRAVEGDRGRSLTFHLIRSSIFRGKELVSCASDITQKRMKEI